MRRRFRRHITGSEWWSYVWYLKILTLLELPLNVARDLTIPTSDEALWNKCVAISHPIFAPLFLLYIFYGDYRANLHGIPLALLLPILSLPLVFLLYILTHNNKPPVGAIFGSVWVIISFVNAYVCFVCISAHMFILYMLCCITRFIHKYPSISVLGYLCFRDVYSLDLRDCERACYMPVNARGGTTDPTRDTRTNPTGMG